MTNEQLLALASKWETDIAVAYNEYSHGQRAGLEQAAAELRSLVTTHEPCELRRPVKLEDYGPVVDEVAPVSKEAWDALKSQGASRDASSTREKVEQRAMELRETGVKLIPNSWRCQHGTVYAWPIAVAVCGCDRDSQRT